MDLNCSPIFKKIEVITCYRNLRGNSLESTEKEAFNNCSLTITGDYLIITTTAEDLSTIGKIFNLSNIVSYKTHIK
jgi:hypothetical protein